jgi:hypothetical protein
MQPISTSEYNKSDLRSYQSIVMRHKSQVPSLLCPDSVVVVVVQSQVLYGHISELLSSY